MPIRYEALAAVCLCLLTLCQGYKIYQHQIPNGNNVPHPCKVNFMWKGVGHQNVLGGGDRNPFGLAFKAAGATWTAELCNADSDEDGKTNGEELGDPQCVWTAGGIPNTTVGLSHPGVCEPTDSADCLQKNAWDIDCSEGEDFTCEGIADPDTVNMTLKFDRTLVPSNETTYICQSFQIPDDREYHLIATKPFISNEYVMHHTVVYGCPEGVDGYETPKVCDMGNRKCTELVGIWTLGLNGECHLPNTGIKVGKGSFSTVLVEHHWNNPTHEVNYYDESGFTLFMTPNLRQYNLGTFATGQHNLELPPNKVRHTALGVCTRECTSRKLNATMYITSAYLHMHYLGDAGSIEQWRGGELIDRWVFEESYSYDLPVVNEFNPPLELRPDDEIKTTCHFNTMSKTEITYTGIATSDEMCYGIMKYYPAELEFDLCVSMNDRDICELEDMYDNKDEPKQELDIVVDNSAPQTFMLSLMIQAVSACVAACLW